MRTFLPALLGISFYCPVATAAETPPHLDTSGVNMQPAYPPSALKDSERGAVVVGVNVSASGTVNYVFPVQTSGFADLDSAAIAGVLGWRFVPAIRDGTKTVGNTAVEIVFQPPDAAGNAAMPAPADARKPAAEFLPASFEIEAPRDEFDDKVKPALCTVGSVRTTVELLHSNGAAASEWKPAAGLIVRRGGNEENRESVSLHVTDVEFYPSAEMLSMEQYHGRQEKLSRQYSHLATFGAPVTLTLSWDSTGLVTARAAGAIETYQGQLSGAPTELLFTMSSGAAKFTNSVLMCRP